MADIVKLPSSIEPKLLSGMHIPSVQIDNLTLSVGKGNYKKVVVKEATHNFEAGTVTCVVGNSGAGKTTFMKALAGEKLINSGSIKILGVQLNNLNRRASSNLRRKTVTTISQDYNLIQELTVGENIQLVLDLAEVIGDASHTISYWLEQVNLADKKDSYPATLSGGEQQRVAIARSMATPHKVILADEPTGALDPVACGIVISLLRELANLGKTCIVATHNADVANSADNVICLQSDGRFKLQGSRP